LPLRARFVFPIVLGLLWICASGSGHASVWRVRADGTGDVPSIQTAIDGASNGDTIQVGPGEYRVQLWIEGKGVVLRSDRGPSETILRGGPGRARPVIEVFFDGGNPSVIEGFTIREGDIGVRLTAASPIIRGNIIEHNQGAIGAGVCCNMGSNAWIEGNLIAHNRTWYQCCFPSRGGGVYADDTSAATIRDNIVAYNTCEGECIGGGISVFIATVEGNTIVGNHADGPAGGIELPYYGATVTRNIVVGNTSGEYGDGIVVFRDATLSCNDVYANGDEDYWGTEPGPGDFSADPRFCAAISATIAPDPLRFDSFNLRADSPCLPGQHPQGTNCERVGARSGGCRTSPATRSSGASRFARGIRAFPNPARAGTEFRFSPPSVGSREAVEIIDAGGRLVARVEPSSPGVARWNGCDGSGRPVAAGLYFVRVASGPDPVEGTILVIR
jgi:hypothetical protein